MLQCINDLMFSGYVIDKATIYGEKTLCMTMMTNND